MERREVISPDLNLLECYTIWLTTTRPILECYTRELVKGGDKGGGLADVDVTEPAKDEEMTKVSR